MIHALDLNKPYIDHNNEDQDPNTEINMDIEKKWVIVAVPQLPQRDRLVSEPGFTQLNSGSSHKD